MNFINFKECSTEIIKKIVLILIIILCYVITGGKW